MLVYVPSGRPREQGHREARPKKRYSLHVVPLSGKGVIGKAKWPDNKCRVATLSVTQDAKRERKRALKRVKVSLKERLGDMVSERLGDGDVRV